MRVSSTVLCTIGDNVAVSRSSSELLSVGEYLEARVLLLKSIPVGQMSTLGFR